MHRTGDLKQLWFTLLILCILFEPIACRLGGFSFGRYRLCYFYENNMFQFRGSSGARAGSIGRGSSGSRSSGGIFGGSSSRNTGGGYSGSGTNSDSSSNDLNPSIMGGGGANKVSSHIGWDSKVTGGGAIKPEHQTASSLSNKERGQSASRTSSVSGAGQVDSGE